MTPPFRTAPAAAKMRPTNGLLERLNNHKPLFGKLWTVLAPVLDELTDPNSSRRDTEFTNQACPR
jgi:hypothetical protein